MRTKPDCINQLQAAGISYDDAVALRRISMTLHRWHELECGDSNDWNSFCLVRGRRTHASDCPVMFAEDSADHGPCNCRRSQFEHNDSGKPFLEVHPHREGKVRYELVPDRERGALKRLARIMARYPGFASYVQGDPRGCALYILRPGDVPTDAKIDSCYNRGIAVYK